jgi:hypothetical protein
MLANWINIREASALSQKPERLIDLKSLESAGYLKGLDFGASSQQRPIFQLPQRSNFIVREILDFLTKFANSDSNTLRCSPNLPD